jgi:hypothetical protein
MTESTVRQFRATVDAVLSQYPFQHGINLRQTYPTALYQAGNKLDVTHSCIVNLTHAIIVSFFIGFRFR